MRTTTFLFGATLGVAVGVGLGAWSPWKPRGGSPSGTPTVALASAPEGLRVSAIQIRPEKLAEKLSATGTLRADESVDLQAETNGKVVQVAFKEGSRVKKGDLLVKLNDADIRAQLSRAVYRRELAEIKERRMGTLLKTGGARQEDYDTAQSDLEVQRAEVELVEALLAKTEIRAPFDGMVGLRFVSEGAFVTPTTRIATLQNLDTIKLDFAVPEKYAARAKIGSPILFSIAGIDRKFDGQIYAADPKIDSSTRTVLLRAMCPNPDGKLFSGAFASVEFTLAEISDAILVPSVSVIPGVSEKYVFVVENGKAARRLVQVGNRTETAVHIVDGLKPGEWVITSGIQQRRGGLPVSVLDAATNAPAKEAPKTTAQSLETSAKKNYGSG